MRTSTASSTRSQTVDIDFRVTFFDRVVVVPKGGDSGAIARRRWCASDPGRDCRVGCCVARVDAACVAGIRAVGIAGDRGSSWASAVLWIGTESLGAQDRHGNDRVRRARRRCSTRRASWRSAVGIEGRVGVRVLRSLVAGGRGVVSEAAAAHRRQRRHRRRRAGDGDRNDRAVHDRRRRSSGTCLADAGRHALRRSSIGGAGYLRQLHEQGTLVATRTASIRSAAA